MYHFKTATDFRTFNTQDEEEVQVCIKTVSVYGSCLYILLSQFEFKGLDILLSLYELGFSENPKSEQTYPTFLQLRYALLTRGPRPIKSITNLLRPFTALGWVFILVSLAVAVSTELMAFKMYSRLLPELDLIKKSTKADQVAIRMLASMTEPDRINYFRGWSTGNILLGHSLPD